MILLDVNVLVYAHRVDMPEHPKITAFLEELRSGDRSFGVPEIALAGLVRIVTQGAFKPQSTTNQALDFCRALTASPRCLIVRPSERHWSIFDHLCRVTAAKGKLVPDAYLAAFAIDRGDEWVTTDADFKKFPGLIWRHPLESQSHTNPR